MDPLSDGITCLKMVSRSESGLGNQNKTPTSPYVYVWDNDDVENEAGKTRVEFDISLNYDVIKLRICDITIYSACSIERQN